MKELKKMAERYGHRANGNVRVLTWRRSIVARHDGANKLTALGSNHGKVSKRDPFVRVERKESNSGGLL